jgi:MFS family permease
VGRGFEALREREFRLLFCGQAVSLLGDGMVSVALVFVVLEVSDSAASLGLVLAARTAPLVVLLLVGGVAADRFSRRLVMIAADVTRCLTQAAMAALLISGGASVAGLAALSAAYGAATAFFYPASTGLIPMTISPGRLQQANALRGLAQATGAIAGPAIAGVLVASAGPGWALAADAGTFAVSRRSARLHLPETGRLQTLNFVAELRSRRRREPPRDLGWDAPADAYDAACFLSLCVPVVAKHDLGGPGAWAVIATASGAGAVVGGLAVLRLHPRRPLLVAQLAVALWAIPTLLLAPPASTIVIAASALAGGAGLMTFNTLWETTLQQHIPPEALSRVSASDWFG